MGKITITVDGDTAFGTKKYVRNIGNNHINRIAAWAQQAYPLPPIAPTELEPNPPAPPAPTVDQALSAWVDGLVAGTTANVKSAERAAARAAVAEPDDIPVT